MNGSETGEELSDCEKCFTGLPMPAPEKKERLRKLREVLTSFRASSDPLNMPETRNGGASTSDQERRDETSREEIMSERSERDAFGDCFNPLYEKWKKDQRYWGRIPLFTGGLGDSEAPVSTD